MAFLDLHKEPSASLGFYFQAFIFLYLQNLTNCRSSVVGRAISRYPLWIVLGCLRIWIVLGWWKLSFKQFPSYFHWRLCGTIQKLVMSGFLPNHIDKCCKCWVLFVFCKIHTMLPQAPSPSISLQQSCQTCALLYLWFGNSAKNMIYNKYKFVNLYKIQCLWIS